MNSKALLGILLIVIALLTGAYVAGSAEGQQQPPYQAQWQEILSHMSIIYLDDGQGGQVKTIRFTGVNVQVVNGTNDTTMINGHGNLVVGYNESLTGTLRTGSHNLILGKDVSYLQHAQASVREARFPAIITPDTPPAQSALYAKDVNGIHELFYREEENGQEVQLTDNGSTSQHAFGNWEVASIGNNVQALSDGILVASGKYESGGDPHYVFIYSDSNSSPSTLRGWQRSHLDNDSILCVTCPVRKGDWYRIQTSATGNDAMAFFLPLSP